MTDSRPTCRLIFNWHVDRVLVVLTDAWLRGAQITKDVTSLQWPLSFAPKVPIVERCNCIKKFPFKSKIIMYIYMYSFALSSSFSSFFFQAEENNKDLC